MTHSCKVIAHRGASGQAPENTLAAIHKALDIGVDMIEIDVRQTRDGAIVLLHDRTLNRTTNGKGRVAKQTLKEVQALDAGSWFDPRFATEGVPTLEEAMQLIDGQCGLLIEIKDGDLLHPIFCKRLVRLIQQHKAHSWVVVQSFSTKVLRAVYRLDPAIELNKLIHYAVPGLPVYNDGTVRFGNVFADRLTTAVNLNSRHFNRRVVRKLRTHKRATYLWTVDDPEAMQRLIKLKADGIITNYPDRLKAVLKDMHQPQPA